MVSGAPPSPSHHLAPTTLTDLGGGKLKRQDSRPASVSGGLIGSIFEDPEAVLKSRHLSDIGPAPPSRIRRRRVRRVRRDHCDCRDSGADVNDVSAVTVVTAITAVTLRVGMSI